MNLLNEIGKNIQFLGYVFFGIFIAITFHISGYGWVYLVLTILSLITGSAILKAISKLNNNGD